MLASNRLTGPKAHFSVNKKDFIDGLGKAFCAAKIISYTQGYHLLRAAANEFGWSLNYGAIALMWRGGCIIRSSILSKITQTLDANPDLANLLLDSFFRKTISSSQQALRRVLGETMKNGIPMPAMSAALAYYDGYRSENRPGRRNRIHGLLCVAAKIAGASGAARRHDLVTQAIAKIALSPIFRTLNDSGSDIRAIPVIRSSSGGSVDHRHGGRRVRQVHTRQAPCRHTETDFHRR